MMNISHVLRHILTAAPQKKARSQVEEARDALLAVLDRPLPNGNMNGHSHKGDLKKWRGRGDSQE